jgi:lysophospholipase L1-like esterase
MRLLVLFLCIILSAFKGEDDKILFVGDSLTAYRGGWQHQVARMLHSKYDNISKGGKRTKWMVKELNKLSDNSRGYTKVIIYGGINDSFSSVKEDETIENIQDMVYTAKEMGAEPIVIVGYNADKVNRNTGYSNEVETKCRNRYIKLQKRIQRDIRGCNVIPMDNTIDRSDSDDGVHLKASGHRKFANWVLKNLEL